MGSEEKLLLLKHEVFEYIPDMHCVFADHLGLLNRHIGQLAC